MAIYNGHSLSVHNRRSFQEAYGRQRNVIHGASNHALHGLHLLFSLISTKKLRINPEMDADSDFFRENGKENGNAEV